MAGLFAPILSLSRAVISAVGKKCLECQCQKQANLLPSQVFPFPSIVLTVLGKAATKGRRGEITKYNLSEAIIRNCFTGGNGQGIWMDGEAVPPI